VSWGKYFAGYFLVVSLFFAKSQITRYWVPIEFSFFLMFFVIKYSQPVRALFMVFFLSLGLDLIFQTGQVKGMAAMGLLPLVYLILKLKKNVMPVYEDLSLCIFFVIFYVSNYYIHMGLSAMFGVYFEAISIPKLLFMALFHTAALATLFLISAKLSRGDR